MLRKAIVLFVVSLILSSCVGQRDGTRISKRSSDGTQAGEVILDSAGRSGSVRASSSGQGRAGSFVSLTVTGGQGTQGSFATQGDSEGVSGSISTTAMEAEPVETEEPPLTTESGGAASGTTATSTVTVRPKEKGTGKGKGYGKGKGSGKAKKKKQNESTGGTSVASSSASTFVSTTSSADSGSTDTSTGGFARTTLIPGDPAKRGDVKKICITSYAQFEEYLKQGYEVTLIRKVSGGNVEIVREVRTASSSSKSRIVSSFIPDEVKLECGVTEESLGIKKRPGESFSSSSSSSLSSSSSSSSSFSSSTGTFGSGYTQGGSSFHEEGLQRLCSEENLRMYKSLRRVCAVFYERAQNSDGADPFDIKSEFG